MTAARVRFLLLCMLALAAVAHAEDYYVPQVANGSYANGSFRTTFVFFNTSDSTITADLELTNDQGNALNLTIPGLGTSDQFTISLPPGATKIYQTNGSGNLVAGAAHVSTTAPIGVSAIFTVNTPNGSFQTEAGVGGSSGLTDFVIPVDVTGSFNTGVALYNIGDDSATATLTLLNSSGSQVGQATIPLAAQGHTAQFVTQLFSGTNDFRGSLRVTSPTPIAAVGLRQNETPLSYTSLPAVPRSSSQTDFNLAQVANGSFADGSFKTTFILFNIADSQANLSLVLTKDDGSPFPVTIPGQGTNSTFNLTLAPGASAFLQTDGTGSLAAGAARITSNVPLGAASIFTVLSPQGAFQTEAGVGDSPAMTSLTLPVDVTGAFDTGIAFFVPGTSSVTLTMKLLDATGAVVSTAQPLVLQAKSHTAKFVTQIFPGTSNFQGSVAINATGGGVSALTLRQHSGPLSYTTLPVAFGASNGTAPQAGPLLSQTRTGIGATADSTLNVTLPAGFKLHGTITGADIVSAVTAKSGANVYSGDVDATTNNYLVVVPAGNYSLTVCCSQAGSGLSSVEYTYTDPNSVQVSGDTVHNITVPALTLFNITGTVSGLPAAQGTSQMAVNFTSTDFKVSGTFTLLPNGTYIGQLPNGNYIASADILSLGSGGFQSTGLYNIGAATVNGAPASANLTAPSTAALSGSVTIAGAPVGNSGALFFASDNTVGTPSDAACVSPPSGSSSTLDTAGLYQARLVTNRSHNIGVSVAVFKGSTTDVAGSAVYPANFRQISLGADSTSDFNLPAFPSQVRITGKVIDGSGNAVKDVSITGYSKELSGAADLAYGGVAATDANGNYELILLRGTNYTLMFIPPLPKP